MLFPKAVNNILYLYQDRFALVECFLVSIIFGKLSENKTFSFMPGVNGLLTFDL